MPQTAQVKFSEIDLTYSAANNPKGISAVLGTTKRGPVNDPSILVTSWEQFRRLYGGFISGNDFPLLMKRALDGGAALRVVNIRHYTDPTSAATLAATKATANSTKVFSLASALTGAHTIVFDIAAIQVSQIFSVSSINTLALLAAKIKAGYASVNDVIVVSATKFLVVFASGAPDPTVTTSGVAAPAVTESATSKFENTALDELFSFTPKYPGADYNNLKITCSPAASGDISAFDLTIELVGEPELTETYKSLKIPGALTVTDSKYLDAVKKGSQLVDVVYKNLSAIATLPIVPIHASIKYTGATDGAAVVDADYIGDSGSKIGLYALNQVDDVMQFAIPDIDTLAVHTAAAAYAGGRKDLVYFGDLSRSYTSESALVTYKRSLNIDSSYVAWFTGGLWIADPITGEDKSISAMGDILAVVAKSDNSFGEWWSFAGQRRGTIKNAYRPVNNFGASGDITALNYLAANQINTVIAKYGKVMVWGNFTGQLADSTLSFLNIRRLNISMKKSISPLANLYLEEPNDVQTWKNLYLEVLPYLDGMVAKRALYDHSWQGDQFAKEDLSDLVINKSADVSAGKYKVRLFAKEIVSMQEFGIEITLTPSSVSFEDII